MNNLRLKDYFRPAAKWFRLLLRMLRFDQNMRGASMFPPGHYYSPLLDIQDLDLGAGKVAFDGPEYWECVDLRAQDQRAYYLDLIERFPPLPFPKVKDANYRYYSENPFFPFSDAYTLSAIIAKERPRRIIEIGSGFSSAVMLDTVAKAGPIELTFIDPFPERLKTLLSSTDQSSVRLLAQQIQTVELSLFDELNAGDILFIDSSHVAKIGSDLTFILLRILPRLRAGVLVHFHDIFYPFSYSIEWIREGIAWNESLFLRAFLLDNPRYEVLAFNSFSGYTFPEIFRGLLDRFLENTGGSFWLRKRQASTNEVN